MTIEYVTSPRTAGANPFAIFEWLPELDGDELCRRLRSMPYQQFLKTAYWFAVSMTAKAKAGRRCQVCNNPNGIEAHHRTYSNLGKEYLTNDVVVLCTLCHGLFHGHSTPSLPEATPNKKAARIARRRSLEGVRETEVAKQNLTSDMPALDFFPLTRELIDQCRTNGSFTTSTLDALGVERPLKSGWTFRLRGKMMTRDSYQKALDGRFVYSRQRIA